MNNLPIGVFDSGIGGLTLVKEVKKVLPSESILYLGDTARVPYGTRSKETVIKFALEDAGFLEEAGVKCIAIACNTASALALKEVRKNSKVKVFDVISAGALDAAKKTKNKNVGVIGTRGTIGSGAYQNEINKLDSGINVWSYPAPLLVPFIEEGEVKGPRIESLLDEYLKPFKVRKIDTLVLGCTHYPLVVKVIKTKLVDVNLIDPSILLAKRIKEFLFENGLQSVNKVSKIKYFVTDLTDRFVKTGEMFLGEKIVGNISKIDIG